MKRNSLISLAGVLGFLLIFLSSCDLAAGIFKAGMGFGIGIIALVVIVVIVIIVRLGRKS